MEEKDFDIREEDRGGYNFIKVTGYFSAPHNLEVRKRLEGALAKGQVRLAFDLSEVRFIDSIGLGLLINFHKKLRDGGGALFLVNPSATVDHIIGMTGSARVLAIRRDVADAGALFPATA